MYGALLCAARSGVARRGGSAGCGLDRVGPVCDVERLGRERLELLLLLLLLALRLLRLLARLDLLFRRQQRRVRPLHHLGQLRLNATVVACTRQRDSRDARGGGGGAARRAGSPPASATGWGRGPCQFLVETHLEQPDRDAVWPRARRAGAFLLPCRGANPPPRPRSPCRPQGFGKWKTTQNYFDISWVRYRGPPRSKTLAADKGNPP